MGIFVAGMVLGALLWLPGKSMEANEKRTRLRRDREERARRIREGRI